jgi:hypothetical protein
MSTAQQPVAPPFPQHGYPTTPPPSAPRKARKWPWIVGIIVALFAGVGIGSSDSGTNATTTAAPTATVTAKAKPAPTVTAQAKPAPTVTVTSQVEPAPAETVKVTVTAKPKGPSGSIEDGIWLVGKDIKAGTYRTSEGGCYWARLSGLGGDFNDIIANGNTSGPTVVAIKKTDKAFESTSCGTWKRIA